MKSLLLLAILFSPMAAASQSPVVRASLSPSHGIIVGQPVRLAVTVLVPNYFTGSPDFPVFEIENAIVIEPQDRPQNLNEVIGGVSYAGIQQVYTIYPQQPGRFQLPPIALTVSYANPPPKSVEVHLKLPPLIFNAEIPEAAENLAYFLPTTQLTLKQTWSSPLKDLRVGDTLQRAITVTAMTTQGMMIPPLELNAPEGIRTYSEPAAVIDQKSDTGVFLFGRRTQSVRYLLQKQGDYTLPSLQIQWWNLRTHRLVTAALPSVHLAVGPNPGYVEELPPAKESVPAVQPSPVSFWNRYRVWIRMVVPGVLCAGLFFWILSSYISKFSRWLSSRTEARKHSEAAHFRKLLESCNRDDANAAYRGLLVWAAQDRSYASLQEWVKNANDNDLEEAVNRLGEHLFSTQKREPWHGKQLAADLRRYRNQKHQKKDSTMLGPLNPSSKSLPL